MDIHEHKRYRLVDFIRRTLKLKKIKQREFAALLHKKPSEISKWLTSPYNFTINTLIEIEQVLGIEILILNDSRPVCIGIKRITVKAIPPREGPPLLELFRSSQTLIGSGRPLHITVPMKRIT